MANPKLDVVRGDNGKPESTSILLAELTQLPIEGQVLTGYPIMKSHDGAYTIDAILISPDFGIACFDIVEGTDISDYEDRQDEAYNRLTARLLAHRSLISRRQLTIPVHVASFAPGVPQPPSDLEFPILDRETLSQWIDRLPTLDLVGSQIYEHTLSAIHSLTTIRHSRTPRDTADENSRGSRLKTIEDSISTLDRQQHRAVIETVEGVQRIRGLAGSGKTVVLALKAAYLHGRHPEWRIGVTFHTRSLKAHLTRLINTFHIDQMGEEPNWDNLRVVNAWGAPGGSDRDGIYHEFCRRHSVEYSDFGAARNRYGYDDAFFGAVEAALRDAGEILPLYDTILVDEAQDLPPVFLRLCYEILADPRRLVYAYDELQNLTNAGLPPTEEIFGYEHGKPRVVLTHEILNGENPKDLILEKCYRNSRPILIAAHALGFGIYRGAESERSLGLVQMFDQPELWTDIGYTCTRGVLSLGNEVTLTRTADSSPKFLESHSSLDDIIQFLPFPSVREQALWVAEQIEQNLRGDELRHEDIMVIHTDPLKSRAELARVREELLRRRIQSHHAGVDTGPDEFLKSASITCTGIHRAKGNEAAMVYIINAHDCHSRKRNLSHIRNRLFTAMTRSKAWVRVSGVGSGMEGLIEEFQRLLHADFQLRFRYPTREELAELTIVHRDMTDADQRRLSNRQRTLSQLVNDLKSGKLFVQDFNSDDIENLREILESEA